MINLIKIIMFKKFLLTSVLLLSALIIIYPSKKEKTNLLDYCYSLEKILSRNSVEKSKIFSEKYKTFAKDITFFGTKNTKGTIVNRIINQYKNSKESFFINLLPNQFYCWIGYWIEELKPGTFQTIFYEKSKQRIIKYKDIKKEVDEFMKDMNSEYKSIKKDINEFF